VPGGARAARADGVPKQAYRRDRLSANYREQHARQAEAAASAAEHRRFRARTVARQIIAANALAVGYGWLAAGMTGWAASFDDEPYEPPLAELGTTCGVVAAIGVALWLARLRGAAVFQVVPLLLLALLMLPS
jgi:hypothetical protein